MGICKINGGRPLYGTVKISGSKNAALPILFSTMLCRGVSVIENCPDISDVAHALAILRCYGAKITRAGDRLTVDTTSLSDTEPPDDDVRAFRASSYLIGACLARFGRVKIRSYGGCAFSDRPIDMHIGAALAKGCEEDGGTLYKTERSGGRVVLAKSSVGATVNAILLSAADAQNTVIEGAAKEPHIDALIAFLNGAGARIGREDRTVYVEGTGALLSGGHAKVIPDAIEAGSYLALGPLTGGEVAVSLPEEYRASELVPFLSFLGELGVSVREKDGLVRASGAPLREGEIVAEPFPGYPTDLQPIGAVLLAKRGGRIRDTVFPDRFGYLSQLENFGIRSERDGFGSVRILPSDPTCGIGKACDLRGGMAALSAALAAKGSSGITDAGFLLRGYGALFSRLSSLGASIDYQN